MSKTENSKDMTEIAKLQARLAELQAKQKENAEKERAAFVEKLNALPGKVGLETVEDLIKALKGLNKSATAGNRGSRIPAEARTGIENALREGTKAGKEIAAEFKVSLPTVQNIKKALGLVNSRTPTATV